MFPSADSICRANRMKARILIVEDDPHILLGLEEVLKSEGYEVASCNRGDAAVEAVEKGSFDAILMDVQMPEMDGFEATAAIREKEKLTGAHIPIIAMTAHALKGDQQRCMEAGMDAYLSKPIRTAELFKTIEEFLNASSAGDKDRDLAARFLWNVSR